MPYQPPRQHAVVRAKIERDRKRAPDHSEPVNDLVGCTLEQKIVRLSRWRGALAPPHEQRTVEKNTGIIRRRQGHVRNPKAIVMARRDCPSAPEPAIMSMSLITSEIAMAQDGGKPVAMARPVVGRPGRFGAILAAAGRRVADLVVPPVCLSCQAPLAVHDALCAACWRQISFIRHPLCDRLGLPLPYDTGGRMVSGAAVANPPDWERARAVAGFDRIMRELIHKLKYADRHDARRLFGRWLAAAGQELLVDADMLVPVPLHVVRLWQRRFNQSALLCAELTRITGVPTDPFVLTRVKATPSQVGLSEAERRSNMSGAFALHRGAESRVADRRIVIVDDVLTTGATLGACARVLRRSGAARIDVLSLAMVTDDSRIDV